MADFMENFLCVVGNIHAQHRNTLPTTEHFLTQIKTNRSGLEITSEKRQCRKTWKNTDLLANVWNTFSQTVQQSFRWCFFLSRRDISSSSCSKSSSFIWEVRLKWSCSFFLYMNTLHPQTVWCSVDNISVIQTRDLLLCHKVETVFWERNWWTGQNTFLSDSFLTIFQCVLLIVWCERMEAAHIHLQYEFIQRRTRRGNSQNASAWV